MFILNNEELELIQKRKEYSEYINRHKRNIKIAFKKLTDFISAKYRNLLTSDEIVTLQEQILHHDDSKFSEFEFEPYRKHFFPCSFEDKRKYNKEFYDAVLHHYNNNDHHPQNPSRKEGLNKIACIHNVLDWIAMSYEFNDNIWEFYNSSKVKSILNLEEKAYIEDLIRIIKANREYFYDEFSIPEVQHNTSHGEESR